MSGPEKQEDQQHFDPWAITGYLISGMAVYGGAGWGIDHWAGTSDVFAPIGIIFGLVCGLYLTFRRVAAMEKRDRDEQARKRRQYMPQEQDSANTSED
jgi:ATP synthase protein I